MTAASSAEPLLVEQHGSTRVLTLNRPQRRNAWSAELGRRYSAEIARADVDPTVRAIVVTGAGSAFCSGADLSELASDELSFDSFSHDIEANLRCRKPVIAAVNGPAVGLGFVQAMYCDVRFVAADACLATGFVRRGFIAEFGIAGILSRLVGVGWATELLLSGRTVTGEQARDIGLAHFVVHPDGMQHNLVREAALQYAEDLGTHCAPGAMAAIKEQIRDEAELQLWVGLKQAKIRQQLSLSSDDALAGLEGIKQGRPAEFGPLT